MKSNFTQALKELTGFDGEPNEKAAPAYEFTENMESASFDTIKVEEPVVTYKEFSDASSEESTRITATMVIKGNIESKDNIFVNGEVVGDIKTSANINATNLILGNVSASEMFLNNARVRGNITLNGDFMVGNNSVVVGDIKCSNLTVAGKIKGNCNVDKTTALSKEAYISGDIATDNIATEPRAKINGAVTIIGGTQDIDADFDFGGEF